MQILSFLDIFLNDNGSLTDFSNLYYIIMQNQPYLSGILTDSARSSNICVDEGVAKTCKKFNSHNGSLSADKDMA